VGSKGDWGDTFMLLIGANVVTTSTLSTPPSFTASLTACEWLWWYGTV
jgi:hypothetical protein